MEDWFDVIMVACDAEEMRYNGLYQLEFHNYWRFHAQVYHIVLIQLRGDESMHNWD